MKLTSLVAVLFGSLCPLMGQTQFFPLGFLGSTGPSEANALTRDGTKAIGYSYSGTANAGNAACWWTSAGIVAVPGQENWFDTSAYGIAADGSVIVGEGNSTLGAQFAWYWTPMGGQLQKIQFPSAQLSSAAQSVSGDGRVVVGTATSPNTLQSKAFRWDRSQTMAVFLPPYPPSTVPNGGAAGVSDDGRRVVGWVQTGLSTQAAARWDDGGNPVLFSQAGDATVAVSANGISPDGSTVVGSGLNTVTGKGVGFKWTAAGGVVALPNPTTGFYAIDGATAIKVSGDGRVIVGYGVNVAGDDEAIFWVNGQPYRVYDVATAGGVLPDRWEPFRAYGVDYFGNSICGYGRATSGKLEAYVLIIDATPTPPALIAPSLRYSFTPGTRTLAIRYATVPGLRYRMRGGATLPALPLLGGWSPGLGADQEFLATPAVTGGANNFFLQLEVALP